MGCWWIRQGEKVAGEGVCSAGGEGEGDRVMYYRPRPAPTAQPSATEESPPSSPGGTSGRRCGHRYFSWVYFTFYRFVGVCIAQGGKLGASMHMVLSAWQSRGRVVILPRPLADVGMIPH